MKKKFISFVKFLLFLAIGVLLLWLAFRGRNLTKIIAEMEEANYWWIFLSSIFAFIAHWSRAIRWNILIEPLGYKPKTHTTFFAVMVGYLANQAFPRMGEISKCGILNKYEKIPLNSLIGTIIIERAIDFLTLIILMFFTVMLQWNLLKIFFMETMIIPLVRGMESKISGSSSWIFLIIFIVVSQMVIIFFLFKKKLKHTNVYIRMAEIFSGLWVGVKTVRSMKNHSSFYFHTVLIWFCYFMMTYTSLFCIPVTANLGMSVGFTVMVIGGLGFLAPVQGGIGAYHWIVTQILMLFAVSNEEGLVWATISHASQMIFMIVVGFISLLLVPYFSGSKLNNSPSS